LRQNINEANFLFYHDYFTRKRKKTSRQRETATKIVLDNSYVIPDSIFWIQKPNSKEVKLFCFELHNGFRILRIENKMKQYAQLLTQWAASDKYDISSDAIVLHVFEKESAMIQAMERFKADTYFTYLKPYFLFKSYKDFCEQPFQNWIDLNNTKRHLLE